jgi:hypothetical protein
MGEMMLDKSRFFMQTKKEQGKSGTANSFIFAR